MKNLRRLLIAGAVASAISISSMVAIAAPAYNSPAEIAASVTGRSVDSIIEERHTTGKSFAAIADEAGKFEEYKDKVIEMKKEILDEKVAKGYISQERENEILDNMKSGSIYYWDCHNDGDYYRHGRGHGGCHNYDRY